MPKRKGNIQMQGVPQFLTTSAVGAAIAFAICLVMMAISAALIVSGKLPESAMLRVVCLGIGFGSMIGGLYAALTLRSRVLPAALLASALCFLLWFVIGQGMYGSVQLAGALRSGICCLIGGTTAGIMAASGKKSRN